MKKEFCRYSVYDGKTGVALVCGEKYKVNQGLEYVESFRCFKSRFKKILAYGRHTELKGRSVDIVYWFNSPVDIPFRALTDAGRVLELR